MGISQQRFLVVRTNHFGFAPWIITIIINDPTFFETCLLPKKNPNNQPTQTKNVPSLKLTARPWKSIIAKYMFLLGPCLFSMGELLVSGIVAPLPKLVSKQTPSPEKVVMAPQAVSETWSFVSFHDFSAEVKKNQGHFLSAYSYSPKKHKYRGPQSKPRNESMANQRIEGRDLLHQLIQA